MTDQEPAVGMKDLIAVADGRGLDVVLTVVAKGSLARGLMVVQRVGSRFVSETEVSVLALSLNDDPQGTVELATAMLRGEVS